MKKILILTIALFAAWIACLAAVPQAWDVRLDIMPMTPKAWQAMRGETLTLTPRLLDRGQPVTISTTAVVRAWLKGTGDTWYVAASTGTVSATEAGRVSVSILPSDDDGSDVHQFRVGVEDSGKSYRAFGTITWADAPGANPSTNISSLTILDWALYDHSNLDRAPFLRTASFAGYATTASVAAVQSDLNGHKTNSAAHAGLIAGLVPTSHLSDASAHSAQFGAKLGTNDNAVSATYATNAGTAANWTGAGGYATTNALWILSTNFTDHLTNSGAHAALFGAKLNATNGVAVGLSASNTTFLGTIDLINSRLVAYANTALQITDTPTTSSYERLTVIGYGAGDGMVNINTNGGGGNDAIGYRAGYNSVGFDNVLLGQFAGQDSYGFDNTFISFSAGASSSSEGSVGIGDYSFTGSTGNFVTAVGNYAGEESYGDGNVFLGYSAGQYFKGTNSTLIGLRAGSFWDETDTNVYYRTVVLGQGAPIRGNNAVSLGASNDTVWVNGELQSVGAVTLGTEGTLTNHAVTKAQLDNGLAGKLATNGTAVAATTAGTATNCLSCRLSASSVMASVSMAATTGTANTPTYYAPLTVTRGATITRIDYQVQVPTNTVNWVESDATNLNVRATAYLPSGTAIGVLATLPLTNTVANLSTGGNFVYTGTIVTNLTPLATSASHGTVTMRATWYNTDDAAFTNSFSGAATIYIKPE